MEGFSISSLEKLVEEVKGIKELNQILVAQLEEANAKNAELSRKIIEFQHSKNIISSALEQVKCENEKLEKDINNVNVLNAKLTSKNEDLSKINHDLGLVIRGKAFPNYVANRFYIGDKVMTKSFGSGNVKQLSPFFMVCLDDKSVQDGFLTICPTPDQVWHYRNNKPSDVGSRVKDSEIPDDKKLVSFESMKQEWDNPSFESLVERNLEELRLILKKMNSKKSKSRGVLTYHWPRICHLMYQILPFSKELVHIDPISRSIVSWEKIMTPDNCDAWLRQHVKTSLISNRKFLNFIYDPERIEAVADFMTLTEKMRMRLVCKGFQSSVNQLFEKKISTVNPWYRIFPKFYKFTMGRNLGDMSVIDDIGIVETFFEVENEKEKQFLKDNNRVFKAGDVINCPKCGSKMPCSTIYKGKNPQCIKCRRVLRNKNNSKKNRAKIAKERRQKKQLLALIDKIKGQ